MRSQNWNARSILKLPRAMSSLKWRSTWLPPKDRITWTVSPSLSLESCTITTRQPWRRSMSSTALTVPCQPCTGQMKRLSECLGRGTPISLPRVIKTSFGTICSMIWNLRKTSPTSRPGMKYRSSTRGLILTSLSEKSLKASYLSKPSANWWRTILPGLTTHMLVVLIKKCPSTSTTKGRHSRLTSRS